MWRCDVTQGFGAMEASGAHHYMRAVIISKAPGDAGAFCRDIG